MIGGNHESERSIVKLSLCIQTKQVNVRVIDNLLRFPRSYHSACLFDSVKTQNGRVKGPFIIITGGASKGGRMTCERFSVKNGDIKPLPSLLADRKSHVSCAFSRRYVYVYGGQRDDIMLSSIERLDLLQLKKGWTLIETRDHLLQASH